MSSPFEWSLQSCLAPVQREIYRLHRAGHRGMHLYFLWGGWEPPLVRHQPMSGEACAPVNPDAERVVQALVAYLDQMLVDLRPPRHRESGKLTVWYSVPVRVQLSFTSHPHPTVWEATVPIHPLIQIKEASDADHELPEPAHPGRVH